MLGRPGRPAGFTLVRTIDRISALSSAPRTAFSTAQATQLVTLLKPLGTAPTLTAAQANSISAHIDRLLTQRPALKGAASGAG